MNMNDGSSSFSVNPKTVRAYAAGRKVSVAGGNINTNPHVTGTPEALAWNRGHRLYASGGTTTTPDNCPEPAKYTAPTVTATKDAADVSGATYDMSIVSPLPLEYHWGDGSQPTFTETGAAKHKFLIGGTFVVKAMILGKQASTVSVTVTIAALTGPASVAFSSATTPVTLTYTENGVGVTKTVNLVSSSGSVFTVPATAVANSSGVATATLTKVGAGTATLTASITSGPTLVIPVTVT